MVFKFVKNLQLQQNGMLIVGDIEVIAASGNKAEAEVAFKVAVKKIDQAVAKGIMKKNTASRKKSQLALKLNAIA